MMTTYQLQHESPDASMPADLHLARAKHEDAGAVQEGNTSDDGSEQEEFNEVVKSVVDDLIQDVVFTSSLREEKRRVQGLINSLVSKVRDEASSSAASDGPRATANSIRANRRPNAASAVQASSLSGVPFGDHRLRHVGSLPVAWMQTMDSITLNISVPSWVRKQHVSIAFTPGSVKVHVVRSAQSPAVIAIDEPLVAKIDTDGCTWALEGAGNERQLTLELEKGREQWWARLFMSDDPKLYTIAETSRGPSSPSYVEEQAVSSRTSGVSSQNVETEGVPRANDQSQVTPQEDQKPNGEANAQRLEGTVSAVVNDVVESVANPTAQRKDDAVTERPRTSRVSQRAAERQQPQKKILTKADLRKLVDHYKEEFRKAGPGAAEAAIQLGTFYHHGIGTEKDDAEAARLYKFGLENGSLDPSAAFQLGIIYSHGAAGLDPNPTEAVRWWKVSASLGNSVAMFNLGVMAINGSGCDMDPVAALGYWQQANLLNPRLQAPHFTQAQMEERMSIAAKQKKEKMKAALSPEERKRRRDEALQKAQTVAYTSAGILGLGLAVVAIRYWWRNRL